MYINSISFADTLFKVVGVHSLIPACESYCSAKNLPPRAYSSLHNELAHLTCSLKRRASINRSSVSDFSSSIFARSRTCAFAFSRPVTLSRSLTYPRWYEVKRFVPLHIAASHTSMWNLHTLQLKSTLYYKQGYKLNVEKEAENSFTHVIISKCRIGSRLARGTTLCRR